MKQKANRLYTPNRLSALRSLPPAKGTFTPGRVRFLWSEPHRGDQLKRRRYINSSPRLSGCGDRSSEAGQGSGKSIGRMF